MPFETIALFFLVSLAAGGVGWVVLYPLLSGEREMEKRKEAVSAADRTARTAAATARTNAKVRREQVEDTLKELEARQKRVKNPPISVRIHQAGLSWSRNTFILISVACGLACGVLGLLLDLGPAISAALAFAGGLGAPRWLIAFLKKRRENAFLEAFPDAVDVIVRGIKAGLPLLDCLKMIALEAPEPVRSEFRAIVETQTVGIPLGEACTKLYERMPLPEANFFGIVISIQQRAGGNLAEALGNLSRVLRDRKRMKAKITAMSMEAKASAMIIAALPFAVMFLVYITSPNYISLLWTEPMGRFLLMCSAGWMFVGILVMRKMINFDF